MSQRQGHDLLADAAAELYTADPDEFIQRRKDLAARARAAGEPGAARQIAGLRKPTRSAWVVNRLVRTDPGAASRLAAMAAELRDTGRSMDGGRIRELTAARGRLVDELTRQALAPIPAPPAALREEVTATLDAALADPQVAGSLGTLVRAAHWAGFGPVTLDPSVAAPTAPRRERPAAPRREPAPARQPKPVPARQHEPAEPDAEPARRQQQIIAAERAVADAAREAEAAATAERNLDDTVRQLEAELAGARQRLAEARRQSYRAVSSQQRTERDLRRLRGNG
ncbi:MAG: hypothetical protein JO132_03990 [Streptosporangiaceae bacterium]|nr:hypothetical protein [Streptosporangiaceae bacterium]